MHSQTLCSANGTIAGSEITTTGLKKAFLKLTKIQDVQRYAPGKYKGLENAELDLVIIEGWHLSISDFIQRVRDANSKTKILFWNLSFFGFNEVVKLDVDGFLSNSKKVASLLGKIRPTEFVMLAADIDVFKPMQFVGQYQHDVTYLGMYHRSKSKEIVELILHEAAQFDLAIYGSGWDENHTFKPNWKGKLPASDIPALYSSAKVVLGTTEDRQRKAGMINNRVFEALACGASFISEHSPDLENVFGKTIYYAKGAGDTTSHIKQILADKSSVEQRKTEALKLIREKHTYDHRVSQILNFHHTL